MVDTQSGGISAKAKRIDIGGDAVGGDKITNVTQIIGPQGRHAELPNQPYFFGRKEELEKIANALDPEAQGWGVLISGPGGIGKTALAIRAGHLAPDDDYPIKIFLSAKVRELTPHGAEELQDFMLPNYMALLAELARELGDENIARIDPNERANATRRLLSGQHALIIIDNLETFDEGAERPRVFQFLSRLPRSCKAIVTSRRRIDVPAEIIRLDRMKKEDALQLIAKLAERNRHLAKASEQERLDLYEITRGHPLMIEWIAGQLGREGSQCRTIADACKVLEDVPKDNDPLEFIFGDLLDTFTEHETAVLAALTYFTQPAQVKWIAEIAKITMPQAETALEDLADRSILVVGEVPDNLARGSQPSQGYLLPPLTATFLRHARPEVIAQAGNSLTDRAYELAQENGWSKYDHFPMLEAEWPTLAAAVALVLQGNYAHLQIVCDALTLFLDFTGHWDEWLSLNLQAEDRALMSNDLSSAGWGAYRAGWVHYRRGQTAEVLACANRVGRYWETGKAEERAYAFRLRGLGFRLAKDCPAAIAAHKEAINIQRILAPESLEMSIDLNWLAVAEQLSGDYAAAERDYREALCIANKVNYGEGVAVLTGNLADLALNQEQWVAAEQLAREAVSLSEEVGRLELIARNCQRIAQACAQQSRKAEGLLHAQRAVAIFAKLRSPDLAEAQAVLRECEGAMQQIDNG